MIYYPDDVIEEVRLGNDLVEVVSEYIHLSRKGGSYFGLCPFHREKTPSFSVEPIRQFYYCFGCNNGGNVFHFIMNIENLDFPEALKFLADRAGIVLPEPDNREEQARTQTRKQILEVNREAARFYYFCLAGKNGIQAQRYLYNRGLSHQTIKKFGLGYAVNEWDLLTKTLLSKGFSKRILIESGLSLVNRKGYLIDRFRNRIMFPIFDIRGNVVAFGGRVLDDSLPKYINSPETLCYSKGRELYGMNLAKNIKEKKLLVVEGYMDVISLHQAGIDYAVASLGTSLTSMQVRLLKKYADEIIVSYDSDAAGRKATERGLEILDKLGCRVKVLQIPDGKDPDDFIRKNGPEEFKKHVDRAISLLEYKIRQYKLDIHQDNQDGRLEFLNRVVDLLIEQDNIIEREMVIKNISRDYDISMDTLQAEITRRLQQKMRKSKNKEFYKGAGRLTASKITSPLKTYELPRERNEQMLLILLSRENHLFPKAAERYPVSFFSEGFIKEMAEVLYKKLADGNDFLLEEYITKLDPEKASFILKFYKENCNFDDPEKAFDDIIRNLETIKLEEEMKDIHAQLQNITDENERQQLKKRLIDIIQTIKDR